MIIKSCYGVDLKEITEKKHTLFLGISLGNRYFTTQNILHYIHWMVENSRSKVGVMIVDEIHAINLEVYDRIPYDEALKRALELGVKVETELKEAIHEHQLKERVHLFRWRDIKDEKYFEQLGVLEEAFNENSTFREAIIRYVKTGIGPERRKILVEGDVERLSRYLLEEVAACINGIRVMESVYTAFPYPGKGVSQLFYDIQYGEAYEFLRKKLKIDKYIASIEMYCEEGEKNESSR